MDNDLGMLAARIGMSYIEVLKQLKENYGGYHFTWPSPDLYNPFSLLKAFANSKFDSYWFACNTCLIEMLDKFGVSLSKIGGMEAIAAEFDAPVEQMNNIPALLYQSGCITIKDYDREFDIYALDIPNKEVHAGLMKSQLPVS